MAALDDSLVRTAQERDHWRGTVFVAHPHDPSIIDFVRDFLRESPEDARELARGCAFFEQAAWLWEVATTSSPNPSPELLDEIREALHRTYQSPGITMVTTPWGPNSWTYRPAGTRDLERRLHFLLDVARSNSGSMAWWRTAFAERVAGWAQTEGEPDSLIKLLSALKEKDGVDVEAAAVAAKEVVRSGHAYLQSLEWLHALRSKFPKAFERDEWESYVEEFETWLRDDLSSSAQDMSDASELEFVDRVAGLYGLRIDDDVWSEAEETVQENERERDAEIEPDPEPDYGLPPECS